MKIKFLILISLLIFGKQIFSQTTISDGQKVTGKWTKVKSPYIISGEAIIPAGSTLTIEAGVEVKFKIGTGNIYTLKKEFNLGFLRIAGTLIAEGTSTDKITFTSDGTGNWGVLLFTGTSVNSSLKYCKIEKASSIINAEDMINFYGALSFYKCSATVQNCEITDNTVTGISCINVASPSVSNCLIANNLNIGLYCSSSNPTFENCTVTGNGWQGIYCISTSKPTIKNSIFWNNSKENSFGNAKVSYCLIEESVLTSTATDGGNNIFEKDPLFTNASKKDYSIKIGSPCVGKSSSSGNIGADIAASTSNVAVVDNTKKTPPVLDLKNSYSEYYATDIKNDLEASGYYKAKGEFETTVDYTARQKKGETYKTEVYKKYELKYAEISKKLQNTEDEALLTKIKDSYTEFDITFFDVGTYDADKQTFLISLKYTTPNSKETVFKTETIKIPITEAPTFKQNVKKVKITACEQLLEDGKTYETFNISIIHPITGTVYPFGLQKEPLYIDENNGYDVAVDDNELNGIPNLTTEIKLVEPSGNNLLDADEVASLQLIITNSGTGSALDIDIATTCSKELGFTFDKNLNIPKIKAGAKETINIQISSDKTLTNGELVFNIKFTEQRGFPPAPIKMTVGTQEIKTPKLYFVEAGITEEQGDKDNIIENGELIFVTLMIQNKGQGKAENVSANILINDKNILAIKTADYPVIQNIGTMEPGEAKKINFYFSINWLYDGAAELPIQIQLTEAKGIYGGTYSLGLSTKTASLATNDVKVEGVYGEDVEIKDASLSVDVDINIPTTGKVNENKYALIIGNENYSKYQNGLTLTSDVEFAIHDAQVFKQYAIKTMGVPETNIIELYDGQRYEMERDIAAFTRLAELADGKAELIIYYAGHGFPDSKTNEAYIMPVDISGADVTNGIKLVDFYKKLTTNPTKKITVFIDACFSGGGRNEGLVAARSGVRIKTNATTLTGKIVAFSASSGEQISLPYKDKQHGLFTYFLLKAMQENKGNLTYGDLADYILAKVQTNSITINKQEQNPKVNVSADVTSEWESWKISE